MKKLFIPLFVLLCSECYSQNIVNLTYDRFIELSKKNSYKLMQNNLANKEANKMAEFAKLAQFMPDINYTGAYSSYWGTNFNLVTNERNTFSTINTVQALQVQTPLTLYGERKSQTRNALIAVEKEKYQSAEDRYQFTKEMTSLFYKALFYKDIINITDSILVISKKLYEDSKTKFKVGSIGKDEMILSESSYIEDQIKLKEYKKTLGLIYYSLKEYCGLSQDRDSIALNVSSTDTLISNVHTNNDINLGNSNQMLIQNLKIEESLIAIRRAKNKVFPEVIIGIGSATRYDRYSEFLYGSFNTQIKNNLGYYVTVATRFSISNLFLAKKESNFYSFELQREKEVKNELEQKLKLSYKEMTVNLEALRVKNENLKTLDDNYATVFSRSLQKAKYGKISELDFLQIKNKYLDLHLNYISSRYECFLGNKLFDIYLESTGF